MDHDFVNITYLMVCWSFWHRY